MLLERKISLCKEERAVCEQGLGERNDRGDLLIEICPKDCLVDGLLHCSKTINEEHIFERNQEINVDIIQIIY